MEIIIKNMVCRHCVASVCDALDSLSIPYSSVEIGRATLDGNVSRDDMKRIAEALRQRGFEIIDDPDSAVVERIKHAVQHHVRTESECRLNLSACIEEHLGQSYDTLSRLFSQREGRTIEKYHIALKIDYVKELLSLRNMTLAEIADMTGYSGAAHLSRQFKAVTGMTPGEYVRNASFARTPLTEL